jgi:hypothetical protein
MTSIFQSVLRFQIGIPVPLLSAGDAEKDRDMTPLSFYLNWLPLCLAGGYLVFRLSLPREKADYTNGDLAWGWFANYSLFNLYFVWCWDYAHAWRAGLLTISTALVIASSAGLLTVTWRDYRSGASRWKTRFFLAALTFVNLPILVLVIWRKTQNLPLT